MNTTTTLPDCIIAPCGINCTICLGFQRKKNKCYGCWGPEEKKPYHCAICSIKNCHELALTESKFCFDCHKYPCRRIKQLDKRYRTKYLMSNIDNLRIVKESGIDIFIELENAKWKCPNCGGLICVHTKNCLACS